MTTEKIMRAFLERKKKLDDVERQGLDASCDETYEKEFAKLREMSFSYKANNVYPTTEGEKSCNVSKNRYKDIIPFDGTRVKLKNLKDGSTSDYINASYIKCAFGDVGYIAAQGPLPRTINDFWQMIWENEVKVILMACREYEGESMKLKCQRYWPDSMTEEMTFGDIKVNLEKEEKTDFKEHDIRHMVAQMGGKTHRVVQLHYHQWPDKGVPLCIPGILSLIDFLRNIQPLNAAEASPILIHCSAGCGRTGTIMVIDFVQSLLKFGKLTEDFRLFDIVADMRRQRMAIVQTPEQYVFLYDAVAELFNRKLKIMNSHLYGNVEIPTRPKPEAKPEIVDVDYEFVSNTETKKPKPFKPVNKPQILPKKVGSSEYGTLPNKPLTSETSPEAALFSNEYSLAQALSLSKEPDYSEPYAECNTPKHNQASLPNILKSETRNQKLKPEVPVEILYTEVKKPVNTKAKGTGRPPSNEEEKKNEYAYANPYQDDKWSLQKIARGQKLQSTDVPSDDFGFLNFRDSEPAYAEVGEFGSSTDMIASAVPHRKHSPDENKGKPKEEAGGQPQSLLNLIFGKLPPSKPIPSVGPYEIAQVIYRGANISFPNRIGTPIGKRQAKMMLAA